MPCMANPRASVRSALSPSALRESTANKEHLGSFIRGRREVEEGAGFTFQVKHQVPKEARAVSRAMVRA